MEKQIETAEEYVKRLVKPIFDKVLNETPKNRMSVGGSVKKKDKFCIYHPHNYRLYIDFDKEKFNPKKRKKPTSKGSVGGSVRYRVKNKTEHEFDDFLNCRITVKKNQIEIQNKIEPNRKWNIKITENANNDFIKIINKKDNQCIDVLKKFITIYGGQSNFHILNRHSENKIWGEDFIDVIPLKAKWHMKTHKKVYNEKNIEFSDPIFSANYIENQAIVSKTPELKEEIQANREIIKGILEVNASTSRTLNEFITKFMPLQMDFAANIKSHTAVIKNMVTATNKLNKLISEKQKKLDDFF